MTENSQSIPKKCPKCGRKEPYVYGHSGFMLGCTESADVICVNCGIFGTVKVKVIPKRGTFELDK